MFKIRTGLLILVISIAKTTVAQPHGVSVWFTGQIPVAFAKKWQWQNDLIYKSDGMKAAAYQRFYRTGVRYEMSDHWSVAGGIGFFSTLAASSSKDDELGKEFRFWEELNYQHEINGKLSFQNRTRVEERFLEATPQKGAYRILNLNDKVTFTRNISKKWDLIFADEFFEQVVDHKLIFNQNRLGTLAGYTIVKDLQIQTGYIWALRKTFSQHIIQFTIKKLFSAYGKRDRSSE
jgi:hypothetical protein